MTRKTIEELKKLAKRYKKHGVMLDDLKYLYKSGEKDGITGEKALIGLRLALAKAFGERDYFTSKDVAIVTGESIEEVNKRIEEHEDELLAKGDIVKISSPFLK